MRWVFGKGRASLQNLGCIGAEGEYYFHPEKPATIKGGPADTLGESQTIAILPHDKVIVPQGKEWLNVYDMKHRQLISDRNSFGICYYSQTDMKVGLVGTTVKVEERRIEEDGRVIALVKGIERFYIEKVIADKPYIVAKVRPFTDYSDTDPDVLEAFETNVLNEILCSFKYMEIMYPHKNYTMGSGLVK
jgi:ATP-dependent Lon protease